MNKKEYREVTNGIDDAMLRIEQAINHLKGVGLKSLDEHVSMLEDLIIGLEETSKSLKVDEKQSAVAAATVFSKKMEVQMDATVSSLFKAEFTVEVETMFGLDAEDTEFAKIEAEEIKAEAIENPNEIVKIENDGTIDFSFDYHEVYINHRRVKRGDKIDDHAKFEPTGYETSIGHSNFEVV